MSKPKTAMYCRVAREDDDRLIAQEEALRHFAKNNGYGECVCYRDNGQSGVTLNRPAMNALLRDIRAGKVNTVIANDISKYARGFSLFMRFLDEAKRHGVTLVTATDGEVIFPECSVNATRAGSV